MARRDAAKGPASRQHPARRPPLRRGGRRRPARRALPPERHRRHPRHVAAGGRADPDEPTHRSAQALRLDGDGPRVDQADPALPRRQHQRRGADDRDRCSAALPAAPPHQPGPDQLPRHDPGERARRRPARQARQPGLRLVHPPADRRARPARAVARDPGAEPGTQGVEAGRSRLAPDRHGGVELLHPARARRPQRDAHAALQPGGDERARPAVPDLHARRPHARDLSAGAAGRQPRPGTRAHELRREALLGLQRRLRPVARPAGVRAGDPRGFRRIDAPRHARRGDRGRSRRTPAAGRPRAATAPRRPERTRARRGAPTQASVVPAVLRPVDPVRAGRAPAQRCPSRLSRTERISSSCGCRSRASSSALTASRRRPRESRTSAWTNG